MAAGLHDLLDAGLTVKLAQELPGLPFSSYSVSGEGFSIMLRFRDDGRVFDPDDQAAVDALLDPPEPTEPTEPAEKPKRAANARSRKAT
jgi:hypothetical protein